MHQKPPQGPGDEPPFMAEFRKIDANITRQVDRYVRWAKVFVPIVIASAFAGQLLGLLATTLIKWWAGIQ